MAMDFGKLDFAVSFNRQTAFPLDAKSYFESLESAQAAAATAEGAGSSNTTYYYGQQVAVVEGGVATLYVIQPDKTLKEVGGKIAINENVFVKDTEGKLDLLGFADAVAGAQLVKSTDGKLSWVKPDTTTVEGLSTAVEGLKADVASLRADVGKAAQGETAATGLFKEVSDIKSSLAQQATDISGKADKADTLAGYGVTDAFTKTETNSALEGKVDKVEGKGLSKNDFTDEFVKKLNDIKLENIQANIIEKITLNGVETQVVEKTVDIPLATTAQFGLVKGSDAENEVAIKEDGIMSVNALNIQKLSQTEGETLVLDCGKA